MMIAVLKPSGLFISDVELKCRYQLNGKFYVVDNGYNKLEVSEKDYMRLKCPIRKYLEREATNQ